MSLEKERPHPNIPEVECYTQLELDKDRDYSLFVFISDTETEHILTIKRLENLSSSSNKNFRLESRSNTDPIVDYSTEYTGQFLIPWIVTARVANKKVFIDYQITLNRPDSTLSFKLIQTERPVLYRPETYNYPKAQKKIKIDGLPAFLQVDEELPPGQKMGESNGPYEQARLDKLSIISKGIKPVGLTVENGNSAKLKHDSEFKGRWYERWTFDNYGEITKLHYVVIGLTGKWMTQRN
ncbi:hypothetical protein HYT32_00660 [Candidatus Roizmanbacteria bacterium]|nr:hypothetical protein [Candidatus Roizmanbacteria bacterium]